MNAKELQNSVEIAGWSVTADYISTGIRLREKFRETLEEIAHQKTTAEIKADHTALLEDYSSHDFESAYDTMILRARVALWYF